MTVLVDLHDVSVQGTDRPLFEHLSLTVETGDRIGVVGINGTGKSTLLRILAGALAPDRGSVRRGQGVRCSFLEQVPELGSGTVRQVIGPGWEAEAVLDRLSMSAEIDSPVRTLSGGQAKRVALAAALSSPSELLILDEPTNHLDLPTVSWLEHELERYRGGIVIVSHDRYLLDRVTTRMVELDRASSYIHEGGYGSYLEATIEREELARSAESTRRNRARRELAWLRRGAQARSTKPRARVEAATQLLQTTAPDAARSGSLDLSIPMPRLGDKVIEVRDASFAFEGQPPILSGVDLLIGPGDRIGIVGANGTGKSTLVELLVGLRHPTSGAVELGPTVSVGYYDQHGATLDPAATVQELVAGPDRAPGSLEDRALMRRFWFTGALTTSPVRDLSGGERRRLQLLMVLSQRPNVLVLDEPTNDLDLETLRLIEEFLEEFAGTLIVISHDRAFVERTCDRLMTIDPSGSLKEVAGGIDAWIQQLSSAPPPSAARSSAPSAGPEFAPAAASSPRSPGAGRRLRELDKKISRLSAAKERLIAEAAATTDHRALRIIGEKLTATSRELSDAEDEWLECATDE